MKTKVLLVGCGDVALRLAAQLPEEHYELAGLRRQIAALPAHIKGIQWDLNNKDGLAERVSGFDIVVITPVPNTRDEAGYRQAYEHNLKAIVQILERDRPAFVLLVSSTRVYHQNQGQWVDETSPCEPEDFRGKSLLAGENALRDSSLTHCVVRFSGIYGPGRVRMLRQVKAAEFDVSDGNYSNRIHSDDCAGVLAHIINGKVNGMELDELYLASDCEPGLLSDVKHWLAEQVGIPSPPPLRVTAAGGRRCHNRRLLDAGYRFTYPSFREGYAALLSGK